MGRIILEKKKKETVFKQIIINPRNSFKLNITDTFKKMCILILQEDLFLGTLNS